jgi:mRNA interferase HigB
MYYVVPRQEMKLIGKPLLDEFKQEHADARPQIDSWEAEVKEAEWKTPQDLKNRYHKASILSKQRVIFNICGNRYRLLTLVTYETGIVLVIKIGTHKEYDNWVMD